MNIRAVRVGVLVAACVVLAGCLSGKLEREEAAVKREREAVKEKATAAADDLAVVRREIEAATDQESATIDWKMAVRALNRTDELSPAGRAAFETAQADGKSPEDIVKAVRASAATRAGVLQEEDEELEARLRDLASKKENAEATEAAWWDVGELGVSLGDLIFPGVGGIAGLLLGRARGIVQGRKQGATQTAQLVGTARVLSPALDQEFKSLPEPIAAKLRQLMGLMPAEVTAAIDQNLRTPLPDAPVVASVPPAAPTPAKS